MTFFFLWSFLIGFIIDELMVVLKDNTNRLEMRLRSIEGQPGTLQVYVTSQVN